MYPEGVVMKEVFKDAVVSGFHGKWTHIDPQTAVKGLTLEKARQIPKNLSHSAIELIYHIAIWNETIMKQVRGESVDWNEVEETEDWSPADNSAEDMDLSAIIVRFEDSIANTEKFLAGADFSVKSKGYPELSIIKLYLVMLQHTSYHIGQIVTIRQCLNDWPPPDYKP